MTPQLETELDRKIAQAMTMAGLGPDHIAAARAGAPIFGTAGMVDSLGLVRLIGATSSALEEYGVDMFDMLQALDVEAADAFADIASIRSFLASCFQRALAEQV